MTERQQAILAAIVEQYAEIAAPVGSVTLAKLFGVSSATIRSEMAKLEEMGFILGLRMDSCCEIVFDNVELEEKDVFGEYGNGFNHVKEEFDAERFLVACTNYGIA